MYPKTPGYINHCPATLCYKLDCLFLELLVVLPSPTTICHLTPPKVIFYLTFQGVRRFVGTSLSELTDCVITLNGVIHILNDETQIKGSLTRHLQSDAKKRGVADAPR